MSKKENKTEAVKQEAKKYVDEQIEILQRHGSATRISKNTYNSMVDQVARVSAK